MRKPSPATIIASVALFFSLAGTGIAAQHYLITSLSQIAPKVRQQLRGARGPAGPQGVQGPQGPVGSVGPTGPAAPITGAPNENGVCAGGVLDGSPAASPAECPGGAFVPSRSAQ